MGRRNNIPSPPPLVVTDDDGNDVVIHPRLQARLEAKERQRAADLKAVLYGGLLPEERHMLLEDYLRQSLRRRYNAYPLVKLQLQMLADLVVAEHSIKQVKEGREQAVVREGEGCDTSGYDRQLFFLRAEQRALRDITDGIAWRLFDYDRSLLYLLADRQSSGHVEPDGLVAELAHFADIFDTRTGIPLLNDLTSCIKLGDITVRVDAGRFELIEVKTGHTSSGRITRQKSAMGRVVEFACTGRGEWAKGPLELAQLEVVPDTYIAHLHRLLLKAEKHGVAWEQIGDHLVLQCMDFTVQRGDDGDAATNPLREADGIVERWDDQGDIVTESWFHERYGFVRNFPPMSVYPLPPHLRVKLMTGALVVRFAINA